MKFRSGDIIVPRAKLNDWPTYGLTVEGYEDETLAAYPLGGGFSHFFSPERVAFHDFIKVPKNLQKKPHWYGAHFYSEWHDKSYRGWTTGDRWNGWATPHFEMSEARRYAADSIATQFSMAVKYDPKADAFVAINEDYPDEPEVYKGIVIEANGKKLKVYPIGAYGWTWTEEERTGTFDWYPEDAG